MYNGYREERELSKRQQLADKLRMLNCEPKARKFISNAWAINNWK